MTYRSRLKMAAEVEFPELRARMIAAVDALAKPYAPGSNAWGESQFSEIFDVLCEELELDEIDARGAVGYWSLLQSVWDETEKYAGNPAFPADDEFQRAPSWPKAIESARRARDSLLS